MYEQQPTTHTNPSEASNVTQLHELFPPEPPITYGAERDVTAWTEPTYVTSANSAPEATGPRHRLDGSNEAAVSAASLISREAVVTEGRHRAPEAATLNPNRPAVRIAERIARLAARTSESLANRRTTRELASEKSKAGLKIAGTVGRKVVSEARMLKEDFIIETGETKKVIVEDWQKFRAGAEGRKAARKERRARVVASAKEVGKKTLKGAGIVVAAPVVLAATGAVAGVRAGKNITQAGLEATASAAKAGAERTTETYHKGVAGYSARRHASLTSRAANHAARVEKHRGNSSAEVIDLTVERDDEREALEA